MQSKVSVRGQTVIPREIRKALGIHPEQRLNWQLVDGMAVVRPLPEDPVRAARGFMDGVLPYLDFMEERKHERDGEEGADASR